MAIGDVNIGQELLNVPMGSMIKEMALAIAKGQWELDKSSMVVAEMMSGQRMMRDLNTGELINPPRDTEGHLVYDSHRNVVPNVQDTRVFFGYTYQQMEPDDADDARTAVDTAKQEIEKKINTYQKELETLVPLETAYLTQTEADRTNTSPTSDTTAYNNQLIVVNDARGAIELARRVTEQRQTTLDNMRSNSREWKRVPNKVSMMELGFTPTFYNFVDTIIEVKIAIKITGTTERTNSSTDTTQTNIDQQKSEQSNSYSSHYSGTNYYDYGWWYYGYRHHGSRDSSSSSEHNQTQTQTNTVQTSQVDATYSNKYSYSAEGSSLLRTKLAPVPPPAILLERIHEVMALETDFQQRITRGEINLVNKQELGSSQ